MYSATIVYSVTIVLVDFNEYTAFAEVIFSKPNGLNSLCPGGTAVVSDWTEI